MGDRHVPVSIFGFLGSATRLGIQRNMIHLSITLPIIKQGSFKEDGWRRCLINRHKRVYCKQMDPHLHIYRILSIAILYSLQIVYRILVNNETIIIIIFFFLIQFNKQIIHLLSHTIHSII